MDETLVYYSAFYGLGGYAVTAAAYVRALLSVPGIRVVPFNIQGRPEVADPVIRALEHNVVPRTTFDLIVHKQPAGDDLADPCLRRLTRAARSISYITVFECDNIPPNWIAPLKIADRIIVPTELCRQAFGRHFENVRRVPYFIAMEEPEPSALPPMSAETLEFLSVISQVTDRKGIDLLLLSYLLAFGGNDRVRLTLKVPSLQPAEDRFLRGCLDHVRSSLRWKRTPPVRVISESLPPGHLTALYRAHDAHVLLSRGEGFGLPFAEAALCGKPSIFPREGGHADFMREGESGWAVDGFWDTAVTPVYPFDISACRWFIPSIESAMARFRQVYSLWICDPDEIASGYGRRAARSVESFADARGVGEALLAEMRRAPG